jgi:hypothetical protein
MKIKIYKTIILSVVLYGYETWSLSLYLTHTLMEEHRLKVFEKSLLRRVFQSKMVEVMGGCRKLYYDELHSLYCSPLTTRVINHEQVWSNLAHCVEIK